MNVEELLRDSLRDMADEGPAPQPDLADRVLRTRARRRTRRYAVAMVGVAAVVSLALAVTMTGPGGEKENHGGFSREDSVPAVDTPQDDVIARPDQSPPRELIAAGDMAVSAYQETHTETLADKAQVRTPLWYLYNPGTGRYEKTDWGWIAVAPGMRTAAVLERDFPVERIGILQLATMKVDHWIPVDKGVAGVEYSKDGQRLLATAYVRNPDRIKEGEEPVPQSARSGFYVLDAASGKGEFVSLPADTSNPLFGGFSGRRDLSFSAGNPDLVWEQYETEPFRLYYDLKGDKAERPAADRYVGYLMAGLSPDGSLVVSDPVGAESMRAILDARTGEPVGQVPGRELLAWADDRRLFAWGCDLAQCGGNEFDNRLLLVTIGSEKTRPLSDFRAVDEMGDGRWTPVFTSRK